MKSQVVRKGITEKQRAKRHSSGDAHRAEKYLSIERIRKERLVVFPIPLMNDDAIANRPKAVREHKCIGNEKERADPQQRRNGNQGFVRARIHEKGLEPLLPDEDSV